MNQCESANMAYHLITVITNRGKGSRILEFAHDNGACDASCLLGKGTIDNSLLKLMEMYEVDKEIIMIVAHSDKEAGILEGLNQKFHFDRQNHGIAFSIPLAGMMKMKRDTAIRWRDEDDADAIQYEYTAFLHVVDKGIAEKVIQVSQAAGYYGGTVIKGRGSAGKLNIVLDRMVEPEKEAVLMVMESSRAKFFSSLMHENLYKGQPNQGFLVKMGVSRAVGLFQGKRKQEEG